MPVKKKVRKTKARRSPAQKAATKRLVALNKKRAAAKRKGRKPAKRKTTAKRKR